MAACCTLQTMVMKIVTPSQWSARQHMMLMIMMMIGSSIAVMRTIPCQQRDYETLLHALDHKEDAILFRQTHAAQNPEEINVLMYIYFLDAVAATVW